MRSFNKIHTSLAGLSLFLCLGLFEVASANQGSSETTVNVSVDLFYTVSASGGPANLAVGSSNYNTIGEYNFIDKGNITVVSNKAWSIKAKLNIPMPTSPGGGYTLKVDDDRTGGQSTGWSNTLGTTDVDLFFVGEGSPTNGTTYGLDWRIEGLTDEDGIAPLIGRIVTFTIYNEGGGPLG